MKAIFSCLILKPDDGFLPHNMPELFNKTGHGLADIVIALDEFGNNGTYINFVLEWS